MLGQLYTLTCKWNLFSMISLLTYTQILVSYLILYDCFTSHINILITDFINWNSLISILDSQSDSSSATLDIVKNARQQVLKFYCYCCFLFEHFDICSVDFYICTDFWTITFTHAGPWLLQCISQRIQMYIYFWGNSSAEAGRRGFSMEL